jgi:hypothetical protein
MRHHRLPLFIGVGVVGLALAVSSCNVSTEVGSYYITYRASGLTGIATIDSVYYSPGSGKCKTNCSADSTMVVVKTPAITAYGVYSVEQTVPNPATVAATLYGNGTGAGTAQFTVIWMTADGVIAGDSLTATTAAGTKFTITIPTKVL